MKYDKIGAVIVAGGLSSRMKDFKPLLNIGSKTMIETTIENYQNISIKNIVAVTGHRADDIEKKLVDCNVQTVRNHDYKNTHMFDSLCIGLKELKNNVDMIFVTPSDSPFVQKHTLKKMIEEMENNSLKIVQPSYEGNNGHPILLSSEAVREILKHDGTNGLQGAIDNIVTGYRNMSFVDPGIVMDADTPLDFFKLVEYNKKRNVPSIELCIKILDYFKVTEEVKSHSYAVAMESLKICEQLREREINLDQMTVLAAALLHDVAKGCKGHSFIGADWLNDMGYEEIAKIVYNHVKLENIPEILTEKEVVYLADKMVKGSNLVSIEDRFLAKESFYKCNEEILGNIREKKNMAISLYEAVFGC